MSFTIKREIKELIQGEEKVAKNLLCELINFSSTMGNEKAIQEYLRLRFQEIVLETKLVPIRDGITEDPEYTFAEKVLPYENRCNLVARKKAKGSSGRSIILQTHSDIVPVEETWIDAFKGKIEGGTVYGRGACDAKGQILVIFLALKALQRLNCQLNGDVIVQIVIEEEIGGNGALSLIRDGCEAEGVIVLEPCRLNIHPANRGALWFRITVEGKSVHMGGTEEGVSSIDEMVGIIQILKGYEKKLLAESRNHPLFTSYKRPVQLCIGIIHGGIWPSMLPAKTAIEGGIGFLPNKQMKEVKKELREEILSYGSDWAKRHFVLEFPKIHNDAYETSPDDPLPVTLKESCEAMGLSSKVLGWNASCDARLYNRLGNMPTVVFGAGDIHFAHSREEQIEIADILKAAEALVLFIIKWCQ